MRLAVSVLLVGAHSASAGPSSSPASPSAPQPTCCRWTANPTCSPIGEECTELHEYLEHKTTTHQFEDVDACLGSNPAAWAWQFDGSTSNTTLSGGSAAVTVPTPLKVTHAADCSSTAPTLTLQMDTIVLGSLTVGGLDVAATFMALVPFAGCLAPAENWRYTGSAEFMSTAAGAVGYGAIVTQTACFESCGAEPSCKQAVYDTHNTKCYQTNTANASDQEGLGGTNVDWVSLICHPTGYAGQPAPPAAAQPTCCRWTANLTCSPIGDKCTGLHEYLEHRTTTHQFEDVDACLGSNPATWAWQFDGSTSNTTLSGGSAAVTVPTPLKVTHAADCFSTLSLQLDTNVLGSLTVGGFDVAATLLALGASPNRRLRQQGPSGDQVSKKGGMDGPASVSALGAVRPGRKLNSASTCCRWTANPTCSPIGDECTELHEYLEHMTTTHHFEDVDACLGSNPATWAWQFDGTTSKTMLSGGSATAAVSTPLKVTHAADCSSTAPTLSLQMNTIVLGSLTVGGLDVAATLAALTPPPPSPPPPMPSPPPPSSPPPPMPPPPSSPLPPLLPPPLLSPPFDREGYNRELFISPTLTWTNARAHCVEQGGDLVSIHSAEENALLITFMQISSSDNNPWFGLSTETCSQTCPITDYTWSDGTATDYAYTARWNGPAVQWDQFEDAPTYAHFYRSGGRWGTNPPTAEAQGICQKWTHATSCSSTKCWIMHPSFTYKFHTCGSYSGTCGGQCGDNGYLRQPAVTSVGACQEACKAAAWCNAIAYPMSGTYPYGTYLGCTLYENCNFNVNNFNDGLAFSYWHFNDGSRD